MSKRTGGVVATALAALCLLRPCIRTAAAQHTPAAAARASSEGEFCKVVPVEIPDEQVKERLAAGAGVAG